jgi:hypothetical protein
MKKKAKENFESNLDNILLDNSTNPKTYWKIMKMLIKSNKRSNCIPPLRNTINDEHLDEMVYDDDKKCELLNKYSYRLSFSYYSPCSFVFFYILKYRVVEFLF